MQKIAIKITKGEYQFNKYGNNLEKDQRELIRCMLFSNMQAQHVDHERDNLCHGKDAINNLVVNVGMNKDVFEAMSSLMFNLPDIFFESGVKILSKHQKEVGGIQLFSGNTVFYLECCINRFLYGSATPISKEQFQSCQILLDALVETGSSGAYYLREYLIRSRRMIV